MNITGKTGYKQTEVGMIPEDWEVIKVGDFLEFKNGLNKASEFFGYGTPIINYMDVYHHSGIKKEVVQGKVFLSTQEKKNFSARKGDVFFTRTSETQEEIGVSAVLLDDIDECVFSGFVLRGRPKNKLIIKEYKQYCFTPQYVRSQIISRSSYTTRALTNGRHLSDVIIIFPPTLAEQRAIATALSEIDALIQSIAALIEKKKQVKQGAMQQLLTGKKRLKGFEGTGKYKQTEVGAVPEDWELRELGEIANINMGQSPLSSNYNSEGIGLPLVQGNADVRNRKTIIRNYTSQITKEAKKGEIIMSVRAPVGEIAKAVFDCCIGRGVCSISFPNDYLYHYLINFENSWGQFSTGSTFDSVNSQQVKEVQIPIPTLAEQRAIAQVLSDMDAEIARLEAKQEKYAQLKQGMMQELLTGKTRLI